MSVATVEASGYKPVQMGLGMVTHCLYPACRRGVRRAGAKNIEGGDVTRGHWEEVKTTLALSHADIIRLGRS